MNGFCLHTLNTNVYIKNNHDIIIERKLYLQIIIKDKKCHVMPFSSKISALGQYIELSQNPVIVDEIKK